jgi:hypothetical protein
MHHVYVYFVIYVEVLFFENAGLQEKELKRRNLFDIFSLSIITDSDCFNNLCT